MCRLTRFFVRASGFFLALSLQADPGPLSIWYTNPAVSWVMEALPVGSGKLAAMVFGGVTNETIQFNEDTIWGGQPHDYSHPDGASYLPQMQASVFQRTAAGQTVFWTTANANWMSTPLREAAYQPAGILTLTFPHGSTLNYLRSLNLDTATASVRYDYNGVTYYRDVFASAPSNHVIVIRLTASQPGKITFGGAFRTLQTSTFNGMVGADLVMDANVTGVSDARYYATGLTNAIGYEARLRVLAEGGTVTAGDSSIGVTNADAVTLLLSVASNFVNYQDVSADPAVICSNQIAAAAALAYPGLRSAQLADYQSLFQRVVLDLGGTTKTNLPTGTRKSKMADGDDPQLVTLLFQLGRYLMISGSRPGSQPLNLQGKWNDITNASWDSKMTLNINEEMNYWGAEAANLSECTLPLFDLIQDLSVSGNRVAGSNYNCSGWVAHHNTDLWRGVAPINGVDGVWPTGGAWLCQHLWWHYLYTGDTNFLAQTAYPLMKGAAQFFLGFLVPHPNHSGWRVTCPSYSPEQDETNGISNVASPTMDNELIRDLFTHVIAASQILDVDAAFRTDVTTMLGRLPPDQIGSHGQLQEWLEDVDVVNNAHRHCSPLVGLFPGDEISPFYTPVTAAGAKILTDWRGSAVGQIDWGKSWRVNLRDRLQDGDFAWLNLTNLIADSKFSTNMVFADNPNRQVDAVFGALSGITEMFLQSQSGEVFLLPALPSKLTNGMVSGLCARGGFEVDNLCWTNGKLVSATVVSKAGNICRLRSKWPVDVKRGLAYVDAPMVLPGLYQFSTVAGGSYTVVAANAFETENLSATTSAGDTHQIITNAAFSNVRGTQLNANAPGDFLTYALTNLNAGNYRLHITADAGTNRARFQLACGPAGGTLTNVGPVQDTYAPTNLVYLLPINLTTPTNQILLWTNQLTEYDGGTWTAPSNGNYQFKFTVVDKNAASSGYQLAFDFIKLTPVVPPPIEQWRAAQFGADTNNLAISGDNADPDGDGFSNLYEYAFGRNPHVADSTNLSTMDKSSGYLTLIYHRAKVATDVTFIVEGENDLGDAWTTNTRFPVATDDGNGLTETVRVQDTVLMNGTAHRFMRVRVTRP